MLSHFSMFTLSSLCSSSMNPPHQPSLNVHINISGFMLIFFLLLPSFTYSFTLSLLCRLSGSILVSAGICRIAELRDFPHQLTLSRNFRVRPLMWSTKNGNPTSSWIWPFPLYQSTNVAMWSHLYWSTCSVPTWLRAAVLQMGHANYIAELRFWWRGHFSCVG